MSTQLKHNLIISAYKRVVECLSSKNGHSIYEATVWTHIILEDLFKSENKRKSPFLYYDLTKDTDKKIERILLGKTSDINTAKLSSCLQFFLANNNEYSDIKEKVELIISARNHICHSIDDAKVDSASIAEAISYVLKILLSLLVKNYGPSLVTEFETEEKMLNKQNNIFSDLVLSQIKNTIQEKHEYYMTLSDEIVRHLAKQKPKFDDRDTFVSGTVRCPACAQMTLDEISIIDFDESGYVGGSSHYICRLCKLEMSDYDFGVIKTRPEITYVFEGDETWDDKNWDDVI